MAFRQILLFLVFGCMFKDGVACIRPYRMDEENPDISLGKLRSEFILQLTCWSDVRFCIFFFFVQKPTYRIQQSLTKKPTER